MGKYSADENEENGKIHAKEEAKSRKSAKRDSKNKKICSPVIYFYLPIKKTKSKNFYQLKNNFIEKQLFYLCISISHVRDLSQQTEMSFPP